MTENDAQIRFVPETTFGTEPGKSIEPGRQVGKPVVAEAIFGGTFQCDQWHGGRHGTRCEGIVEAEFAPGVTRLVGVKCSRCEATRSDSRPATAARPRRSARAGVASRSARRRARSDRGAAGDGRAVDRLRRRFNLNEDGDISL